MITRSKQSWTIGSKVNVGFLKGLTVVEAIKTPGDYKPDIYILVAANGARYEFTPHNGIARID
jgi:hypothetical protein